TTAPSYPLALHDALPISYRELEAFAQFGSDLDEATQARLNRGERTVEVLKQGLHKPIAVEKQVLIIYALTNGYLDDIPVEDVMRLEEAFHVWLDQNGKELLDSIRETGNLPDQDKMNQAVESFKKTFLVSE